MSKGTTPDRPYSTLASCCLFLPVASRGVQIAARCLPAIAALLAPLTFWAGHATAQPQCGPRDSIRGQLTENYKETPIASGIAANGRLVEVFSTPDGRTWTIVITTPNGISCLAASGESWQTLIARMGQES